MLQFLFDKDKNANKAAETVKWFYACYTGLVGIPQFLRRLLLKLYSKYVLCFFKGKQKKKQILPGKG